MPAGIAPFGEWAKHSEAISARRSEKLDALIGVLYTLLEDALLVSQGVSEIRNVDIRKEIERLAGSVTFRWIRAAVEHMDELAEFAQRNIQKALALDALRSPGWAVEVVGAFIACPSTVWFNIW